MSNNTLCLACLSYNKPQVLQRTLETYKQFGLLDYVNEKAIFFNCISQQDVQVAEAYGFKITGSDKNIGIGRAWKTLALNTKSRYILLMENDFDLIESKEEMVKQLDLTKYLLRRDIDCVKLRHIKKPGEPFFSRSKISKSHLMNLVFWFKGTLPPELKERTVKGVKFWYSTAHYNNYSNNPSCYNRRWFIRNIVPYCSGGGIKLEGALQPHWQLQSWKIAQLPGLFRHNPS